MFFQFLTVRFPHINGEAHTFKFASNELLNGLLVTGHNITNAATDGFHRQEAVQGTQLPQETGAGFFGKGVTVETVRRVYGQFLESALLQAQTQSAYLDAYGAQIRQIDNLLADPVSGLSPALQDFFAGVQDVASNPASIPSRQQLLSQGASLVARFETFSARLTEMRSGVNQEISNTAGEINSIASNVARLNQQIMQLTTDDNRQANDLLDARDALLSDLNKLVRTSVVQQSDGSINVFIGTGQTLVLGTQTYALAAGPSSADPQDYGVFYLQGATRVPLNTASLQGGALSGLVVHTLLLQVVFHQQIPLVLEIALHVLSLECQQLHRHSGDAIAGGEGRGDGTENQGNDQKG